MRDESKRSLPSFITRYGVVGWVAIIAALILMSAIIRGFFFNTPEKTVTPLAEYSSLRGNLKSVRCGETSAFETILYVELEGFSESFEVRTNRYECPELLRLAPRDSTAELWEHPSVDGWVGQLNVDGKTVVPHSDAYDEAWEAQKNFALFGGAISLLLLYYALFGQFKGKRSE